MGDLTKNISRHELKCRCRKCDVTIQDHEPIIQVVQGACDWFANNLPSDVSVTVVITSAARCYEYNRSNMVDSNDESQHPRCSAMDIKIYIGGKQLSPLTVFEYFCRKYQDKYGKGNYKTFTHIDTRSIDARW